MRYRAGNLRNSYLFFYTSLLLLIFILRISSVTISVNQGQCEQIKILLRIATYITDKLSFAKYACLFKVVFI